MTAKRKSKRPKDTPEAQYARFLETAKKVEADERPEKFDEAFMKVTASKGLPDGKKRGGAPSR